MTEVYEAGTIKRDRALEIRAPSGGPVATLLCARQDKITITFDDEGNAAITQTCWPDEDQTIIVSRDNIENFIDRLTDALGIPAFGGPPR